MALTMELPKYFLADLPSEAELTPTILADACETLKRNREIYLPEWSTTKLIALFDQLGRDWLDPEYPFRKLALEQGPTATGFSRATLEHGLNSLFESLTSRALERLIVQDLGHLDRFDGFQASEGEPGNGSLGRTRGPELIAQISAGLIPNSTVLTILFGMLTRSAQVVKCASGAAFLPRLFAHSLYQMVPKLGACLEIVEWRGGDSELEAVLFEKADCVVASGSDETLVSIRQRLPARSRFLGYGHRVSFGFVTTDVLSASSLSGVVGRAAMDVAAWDQLGCLSPHVFYVEHGGRVSAEQFAEALGRELDRLEQIQPRGSLAADQAAVLRTRRGFYELRASALEETQMWASQDSTAWTVVYEADPLFQMSCLNRFIYVKGVSDLKQALEGADAVRHKVSTVGLASAGVRGEDLAGELAAWGVPRICELGRMQKPPLTWRHDGRPALGDLALWTDWER